MLSLRAVRFQNCFSFGNEMTEIRLDRGSVTLVVGKNGAGKSSAILDTIVYALYGKPYRKVKLGQLVNSITGRDMLVEIDFTTRGKSWTVRRGQKPSVFEIYEDGVLVDQSDKNREQQDWLEKSVLRMDYRSFTQTVILGSATHVPFMQLTTSQRREVIEDILDIQVFSLMNDVLKDRVSDVRSRATLGEKELAVATRELEVEERHLESARGGVEHEIKSLVDKASSLVEERRLVRDRCSELAREAASLTELVSDAEAVKSSLYQARGEMAVIDGDSKRVAKVIEFFTSHESCPTCSQNIDHEFRMREVEARRQELERMEADRKLVAEKLERLETRLSQVEETQRKINETDRNFVKLKSEESSITARLGEIKVRVGELSEETKVDEQALTELRNKVVALASARDAVMSEARTMALASSLLKDGGIKAKIVAQYVPLMNRLINKYLADLEMFVDFHLDENFSEEIRSRHRDVFSYENFSEGEKLRIDLAILFAWRDIARMRNSSAVDLIVFDEVLDGSLDSEGADYFLNMVGRMVDGRVFIISHRDGLEDKFNRTLTFVKRNNFSACQETGVDTADLA